MLEVLTQPQTFFQNLNQRKPNLVMPFLVAVLAVGLAGVGGVLLSRLLPSLFAVNLVLQLLLGFLGAGVFGIALWALGGLVIRLFAGPDSRAWEVYGWASAPALLVALLLLPISALFPVTGDLPPLPTATDLEAVQEWQKGYNALMRQSLGLRLQQVLGLAATLWSLWIIRQGLKVFSPGKAALTTLVVGVVSLALSGLGWLGG